MEERNKYTISDMAQMLGVAPSTISRALSGKKGVSLKQREKILALANEIGYLPASGAEESIAAAKDLRTRGGECFIALILGDIQNPFYTDLVHHIQQMLDPEGYQTVIFNSEYQAARETQILQMAEREHYAGVFLVTAQPDTLETFSSSSTLPVVLINRNIPSFLGNSVFADNYQAGYMAAVHLIELNHRKIGFIRGPETSSASNPRYDGYKQSLTNFGIPLSDGYIFNSDLTIESGRETAKQFLSLPSQDRPTAMIIVNDLTAIGFIDECRRQNFNVPEMVSVISFDNIVYSSLCGINLTTVSQQAEIMGREAARLMLKQMTTETDVPERVIITPELILRGTTAACQISVPQQ